MYFSKMIDMAKSPAEVKEELKASVPLGDQAPSVPVYPWGLCVRLEEDTLQKLGIDEMPEEGDMIHLCAMAKVTAQNSRLVTDGNGERKERCVELQITHLALEDEDQEGAAIERAEEKTKARRGRFYGPDAA